MPERFSPVSLRSFCKGLETVVHAEVALLAPCKQGATSLRCSCLMNGERSKYWPTRESERACSSDALLLPLPPKLKKNCKMVAELHLDLQLEVTLTLMLSSM